MAADIIEISPVTDSDHETLAEILRLLRKHDQILETFRPLIEKFAVSPAATRRAVRKAARNG